MTVAPPPIGPEKRASISKGCVAALVVGALVLVGGVVGVVYFFNFAMDMVADQVRREVEDNPVIVEHVGIIEEIDTDLAASANEPGVEVFVFSLTGSKGNARLTVETVTVDADREQVTWGRLRTQSGEEYDLFPDQGPKPTQ